MAAKTATVRSISTAAAAMAAGKLPCPEVEKHFPEKLWSEFGSQVEDPKLSQRPHDEQVNTGMWDHLEDVCSTQATLEVVEIVYISKGRGRRRTERRLVDGYHRLYYWFRVRKDGCPFYQLNVVVHRLEVSADAHAEEVDELVDELARTINSKQSVKSNADFLTAAVREAFGKDDRCVSKAYRLGTRAVSYLKRTIGEPAKLSGPKLKAEVLKYGEAHKSMDTLFLFTENNANVRKYAVQVFHTGIAKAMFDSLTNIPSEAGRSFAVDVLKQALEQATTVMAGCVSPVPCKPVVANLVRVLGELADPKVDATLRATGGNREGFYTKVAEYMADALNAMVKAAKRK